MKKVNTVNAGSGEDLSHFLRAWKYPYQALAQLIFEKSGTSSARWQTETRGGKKGGNGLLSGHFCADLVIYLPEQIVAPEASWSDFEHFCS